MILHSGWYICSLYYKYYKYIFFIYKYYIYFCIYTINIYFSTDLHECFGFEYENSVNIFDNTQMISSSACNTLVSCFGITLVSLVSLSIISIHEYQYNMNKCSKYKRLIQDRVWIFFVKLHRMRAKDAPINVNMFLNF